MLTQSDVRSFQIGAAALGAVAITWLAALVYAPVDATMGDVYRILYVHVPCALVSFISSFVLFVFSVLTIRARSDKYLMWSKACAETGFLFTVLTLAEGSIWGKPTWGVWWTWDPRLTTTLLLAVLYAGYLLLMASLPPGPGKSRVCAVLGVLIFADVPIIYESVVWWRTLHQPMSTFRRGGARMDADMLATLGVSAAALLALAAWYVIARTANLKAKEALETQSLDQMRTTL